MELACPSCPAKYNVPDGAIGPKGRVVECSACGEKWFQAGEPVLTTDAGPAEKPVSDRHVDAAPSEADVSQQHAPSEKAQDKASAPTSSQAASPREDDRPEVPGLAAAAAALAALDAPVEKAEDDLTAQDPTTQIDITAPTDAPEPFEQEKDVDPIADEPPVVDETEIKTDSDEDEISRDDNAPLNDATPTDAVEPKPAEQSEIESDIAREIDETSAPLDEGIELASIDPDKSLSDFDNIDQLDTAKADLLDPINAENGENTNSLDMDEDPAGMPEPTASLAATTAAIAKAIAEEEASKRKKPADIVTLKPAGKGKLSANPDDAVGGAASTDSRANKKAKMPDADRLKAEMRAHDNAVLAEQKSVSRFRLGFMISLLMIAAAISLYMASPLLAKSFPASEPLLRSYVEQVNTARANIEDVADAVVLMIDSYLRK